MKNQVRVIAILGFAVLLIGSGAQLALDSSSGGHTSATVQHIGSAQLSDMLGEKDFVLINVHVPYEGEIGKTDLFIPYDRIADNIDELPADKSTRIVVYCRTDRMSKIAAQELTELGYTSVSNHVGGMEDWEASGAGAVIQRPNR
jgi:rhodanese-related sulfurtransferase